MAGCHIQSTPHRVRLRSKRKAGGSAKENAQVLVDARVRFLSLPKLITLGYSRPEIKIRILENLSLGLCAKLRKPTPKDKFRRLASPVDSLGETPDFRCFFNFRYLMQRIAHGWH